jgi:lipopolysaccharide assembly protein A
MGVLIAIPVLIALALFAVSNRQPVTVGFWPTDFSIMVPLAGAVLAVAAFTFLVGGFIVWVTDLRVRRRARRAEARVEVLEEEVRALRARLPRTLPPPV